MFTPNHLSKDNVGKARDKVANEVQPKVDSVDRGKVDRVVQHKVVSVHRGKVDRVVQASKAKAARRAMGKQTVSSPNGLLLLFAL